MTNILIVEDNISTADLLKSSIKDEIQNVNVMIAGTYKEALKFILDTEVKIDFAILDLGLPDTQACEIVKLFVSKKIRSIIYSAILDNNMAFDMIDDNIVAYIEKGGIVSISNVIRILKTSILAIDKNILLVDDSKIQLKIIQSIVEDLGFNTKIAHNGKEALEIMKEIGHTISLVITDYNMPIMNGVSLTLELRKKYPHDTLGIIVLSSNEEEDTSAKFIKIGASDFINKPYHPIEIKTKITSNLINLELFREMKELANKDFLTNCYNRRFFYDSGEAIFQKAKREEKNLVIATIDIDNFKAINDTYGHDVGDVAIKNAAKILQENLRSSDMVARFGGEEFCIILEKISLEDTKLLFEKIRDIFEKNTIEKNGLEIRFTTSIGICYGIYNSLDEMIKISDNNLYYCKKNGRNQIAINK